MLKLVRLIAIAWCALFAFDSLAVGATLHAQLFPHTGEVRLRNKGTTPVSIVFYSINSASGSLNSSPAVWRSVEGFYDVSGNGFVDPNGEWTVIEALSNELTEGALDTDGGNIAAQRSVSFGRIWNPNIVPVSDLVFQARELNEQPITIVTELTVSGDYFVDGVVNQTDYAVWRQNYGSTTMLDADGNLNGIVDPADYAIWRKNLGRSVAVFAQAAALPSLLPAAVPEPTAVILLIAAGGFLYVARMRRPRQ
ncbi:MAG TPA: PEP-CTERM sorting domain-containing protein [Lacipirellulaceae bacterium]